MKINNNNNDFKNLEEMLGKIKNIFIFWSGLPYVSSILFISSQITELGLTEAECIKDPQLLKKIRNIKDIKRLEKQIEDIASEKSVKCSEYEMIFLINSNLDKEIWIKENTRIFFDDYGNISAETIYLNVTEEKISEIFIKQAVKNIETSYNSDMQKNSILSKITIKDVNDSNFTVLNNIQNHLLSGMETDGLFFDNDYNEVNKYSGIENEMISCYDELSKEAFVQLENAPDSEYIITADISKNIKCICMPVIIRKKQMGFWNGFFTKKESLKDECYFIDMMLERKNRLQGYIDKIVEYIIEREFRISLEQNLAEEIKRNEVFAYIIQLLESEKEFGYVAHILLEELGYFMKLSNAFLIELPEKIGGDFHEVSEWRKNGSDTYLDKFKQFLELNAAGKLLGSKEDNSIIIVSKTTGNSKYKGLVEFCGASAMLAMPIFTEEDELSMYAVFFDDEPGRDWGVEDINFVFNICKVLESIIFKRNSKETLKGSYIALKELLDNMGSMIFVSDIETKEILFCNKIVKKYFGEEIKGTPCKAFQEINDNKEITEYYDKKKNIWNEIKRNDITWIDGKKVRLWVITNITEKKKYEKKIEYQANNDFLTGLFNRKRGEEELSRVIKKCIETKKEAALLFLDLDNFKNINDGLGHQYGDMLLRMVSLGMCHINGIGENCYRFGGDEFIIIIQPEYYDEIDRIIEDLIKLFNNKWELEDKDYYCTMSMGVVIIPEDGTEVNELIRYADIAMYEAKNTGKNRYRYYNYIEEKNLDKKLDIEFSMRNAVENGCEEFKVYLQPIFDADRGVIENCEALVRWENKELGILFPNEFISFAEHIGTIYSIGEHVLRQACILNKKWETEGYSIGTNVNISMIQIMQNDIVDIINSVLKETGVNPKNIVLEITENIAAGDIEKTAKVIDDIRKLGVGIALDDFGTGYSSLSYIKHLRPDIIKVDKVFIDDIETDPYAKTFIKMIVEIAKVLEVKVCIEGVENEKQFLVAASMGASCIQGFHFGKAVVPSEFENKFLFNKKLFA